MQIKQHLVQAAKARATGADIHCVNGILCDGYVNACGRIPHIKDPLKLADCIAWAKYLEEVLFIYANSRLTVEEAFKQHETECDCYHNYVLNKKR